MLLLLLLLLLLLALAHSAAALPAGVWSKVTLDLSVYPLARCLDGSPGAMYIFPGDSQYVLHLQGGGYCTSLADCAARAAFPVYSGEASIGSTSAWSAGGVPCSHALASSMPPCASDGGSGGLLSANASLNPTFATATKVWLGYCDGGGFSGTLPAPVAVNATHSVHFAGSFILDALLDTLLAAHGMASASAVVLKGCSAGGASAFSHADSVAGAVARGTGGAARYAAVPGAGFLLDTPPYAGQANLFTPMVQWVYASMGANASGNAACTAAHEAQQPGSGWRCLIAQHVLPYIASPLFVANSAADAAQLTLVMRLGCWPPSGSCNASQLAYLDAFHATMVQQLAPVLHSSGRRHGAFVAECAVHMMENVDGMVGAIHVQGLLLKDVLGAWWSAASTAPVAAVDEPWTAGGGQFGGNAECGSYGPLPSWPTY